MNRMPVQMNSTGQQEFGNDTSGTSDAIVMASAPDVALPLETESAAEDGVLREQTDASGGQAYANLPVVIAAAGAAGLLLGMALKKSLPSVKGRR
jgi:hypothetical protein